MAYHSGEIAVQTRAGLDSRARSALRVIGDSIPPVAAAFLAEQPMIIAGGADAGGNLWATQLTGPPGFLRAVDPWGLLIDALPPPGDPLARILGGAGAPNAPVHLGLLAIEPATRRRMRLNGRAVRAGRGLHVDLDQVFSNCPKYLQQRELRPHLPEDGTAGAHPGAVSDGTSLSPAQQRTVGTADTFFIATASDDGDADASHRGGNPGFVQVVSPTVLRWPDYVGNAMFMTLGNLALHPGAGLLFPGWETGSALQLTGSARVLWDPEAVENVPGAQRMVEYHIRAVREIAAATPLRWSAPAYSRFNPPTH
ncbi:hypothetical protein GCM10018793_24750 [Streptomyces sulfonofaciens]|uniref:Pyridoxamine 5'-phosphate oxidase N-terminal domain-containing protein n=1 Tax=Streptomyces sulfonofaciens TaxID=68272 RepID=A0A919G351_9ACTN|nr:pyridoxamine 5'-phosphate oxidase family protein [Streptomyces sulfonofaciens]GHH77222.1 hypothetical protein GCM10018793_24750 [Streptomyces sulfonofaciens]